MSAGITALPLHQFRGERTSLLRLAKGSVLRPRPIDGGEELFVLRREIACGDANDHVSAHTLAAQTWLRWPSGVAPTLRAIADSEIYVKQGYLIEVPPAPKPA